MKRSKRQALNKDNAVTALIEQNDNTKTSNNMLTGRRVRKSSATDYYIRVGGDR